MIKRVAKKFSQFFLIILLLSITGLLIHSESYAQLCPDGSPLNDCGTCGAVPVEVCDRSGQDEDCDREINEGCECINDSTQNCYPVSAELAGTYKFSPCKQGTQTCSRGVWLECVGAITPTTEVCGDEIDQDCDGRDLPCEVVTADIAPTVERIIAECIDGEQQRCITKERCTGYNECIAGRWGLECIAPADCATEECQNGGKRRKADCYANATDISCYALNESTGDREQIINVMGCSGGGGLVSDYNNAYLYCGNQILKADTVQGEIQLIVEEGLGNLRGLSRDQKGNLVALDDNQLHLISKIPDDEIYSIESYNLETIAEPSRLALVGDVPHVINKAGQVFEFMKVEPGSTNLPFKLVFDTNRYLEKIRSGTGELSTTTETKPIFSLGAYTKIKDDLMFFNSLDKNVYALNSVNWELTLFAAPEVSRTGETMLMNVQDVAIESASPTLIEETTFLAIDHDNQLILRLGDQFYKTFLDSTATTLELTQTREAATEGTELREGSTMIRSLESSGEILLSSSLRLTETKPIRILESFTPTEATTETLGMYALEICSSQPMSFNLKGPCVPSKEICDGVDNDCDEDIDEDLVPPPADKTLGVCIGSVKVCSGKSRWIEPLYGTYVDDYQEKETGCDGYDNNCNGLKDEGCDCETDDEQPCGTDKGECEFGTQRCVDEQWGYECEREQEPTDEICDERDNNCNGQTDEGFDVGDSCTVGTGACETTGQKVCSRDGSATECDAQEGTPAEKESCNDGIDNDCDGEVDEDCRIVSGGASGEGQLGEPEGGADDDTTFEFAGGIKCSLNRDDTGNSEPLSLLLFVFIFGALVFFRFIQKDYQKSTLRSRSITRPKRR